MNQMHPIQVHWNHSCVLRDRSSGPHTAEYYCIKCRKHVMWAGKRDMNKPRGVIKPLRILI